MRGVVFAFWCVATLVSSAAGALANEGARIALVIGNGRYAEAPLKNPVNDARAMTATLRARGFDVIARENVSKRQMEEAMADFGEKLSAGATGLFFYAGHGLQVNGHNYLIPVDAKITSEARVRLEGVDVDAVVDQMQAAKSKVSIVILDACRNNPFERRFRGFGGGLAQISAPEGTIIGYATAPGKVAADGDGSNGLYTQELLKALDTPGLRVEDIFKQVRINVSRASDGGQVPWEASSLTGDFYFIPPALVAAAVPAPVVIEEAFWTAVKDSTTPAEIDLYLRQYPSGTFAAAARARLAQIEESSWTRVKDRATRTEVELYLRQYPSGRFVGPAQARLAQIEETAWRSVKDSAAPADLETYLRDYPSGTFANDARARLRALLAAASPPPTVAAKADTPAPASVAASPAAPPPQQSAARPPDGAARPPAAAPPAVTPPLASVVSAAVKQDGPVTLDGQYTTTINIGPYRIPSTLRLNGTELKGFGFAYNNNATAAAAGSNSAGPCRIEGAIDVSGAISRLDIQCRTFSLPLTGAFARDAGTGKPVGETKGREPMMGSVDVRWQWDGA